MLFCLDCNVVCQVLRQVYYEDTIILLQSEIPSSMCAKLRTVAASNNREHARYPSSRTLVIVFNHSHVNIGRGFTSQSLLLLLAHATYIRCYSSRTSRLWWITQSTQCHRRGCNNIPSFWQRTTPIACSLCEGWTRHDLHILVTAPFCCNRKARVACAQSFAPWKQATIEIMLAISLRIS